MTRLIIRVMPVAGFVLLCALPAAAQKPDWQGAAKLKGKVVDEEGKNVKDAVVKLRHSQTKTGPDLTTKGNGEFEARNIRGGTWEIEITRPEFAIKRLTVEVPERGDAPEQKIAIARILGAAHTKEMNDLLRSGDVLAQEGKLDEARKVYAKVLEGRPDAVIVNRSIAATYYRENKHADALKYLDLVIVADPSNENLQLGAVTAAEAGDLPKMNEYLGKMNDATMASADMLSDVAITLINKKQFPEAEKVLDRVLTRFPDSAANYYYRALARLQQQKVPDGKADLEKFVTMAGADPKQVTHAKDLLGRLK